LYAEKNSSAVKSFLCLLSLIVKIIIIIIIITFIILQGEGHSQPVPIHNLTSELL
jgi:hypothetical protein